eukprot:1383787-Ditylum_brightwellii.AAC.1
MSSDGKQVLPHILSDNPQKIPSQYKWPQQAHPNSTTWQLWCKALFQLICNTSGMLHNPLGPWTTPRKWTTISNNDTSK